MTTAGSRLIPYITAREGEEADSYLALRAGLSPTGVPRLGYWDETAEDRDPRGVLWGRCSQSIGPGRLPMGRPRWRLVHPARQRGAMLTLRCQVCMAPTNTPDGHMFLESGTGHPDGKMIRTAQPPVCLQHVRYAAEHCPHLAAHGAIAVQARSAPLYGVIGTPYRYDKTGIHALAGTDAPLPYGHPALTWFLASQLVRTLHIVRVLDLDDLPPAR